jgi:hypothetical protein
MQTVTAHSCDHERTIRDQGVGEGVTSRRVHVSQHIFSFSTLESSTRPNRRAADGRSMTERVRLLPPGNLIKRVPPRPAMLRNCCQTGNLTVLCFFSFGDTIFFVSPLIAAARRHEWLLLVSTRFCKLQPCWEIDVHNLLAFALVA